MASTLNRRRVAHKLYLSVLVSLFTVGGLGFLVSSIRSLHDVYILTFSSSEYLRGLAAIVTADEEREIGFIPVLSAAERSALSSAFPDLKESINARYARSPSTSPDEHGPSGKDEKHRAPSDHKPKFDPSKPFVVIDDSKRSSERKTLKLSDLTADDIDHVATWRANAIPVGYRSLEHCILSRHQARLWSDPSRSPWLSLAMGLLFFLPALITLAIKKWACWLVS